ncbi:MAG: 3-dehydroquinate synthase [Planctomycetes bacterium]|nr:3-dehydroquinate synthase [Planctomycetota bacterium]MCL4728961.1 3-dehydroquinate synthase [Planctomycetota bacterium]
MYPARVTVQLAARSYDVAIGRDVLGELRPVLAALKPSSLLLVSDANVAPLHAPAVRAAVHGLAELHEFVVPAGEGSKSPARLNALYDWALGGRIADRRSVVLALGGGVIGDLAGYFAATLMRGVPYIQLPASLLAMVDSSVGGKVAINHAAGKNLIGAFHQPAAVICELAFLDTLPRREYVSALAEVVKTAALAGDDLHTVLDANPDAILARDHGLLARVVQHCVRFKAGIVARDETETTGQRATLNLGHTLAHVLETAFPDRYLHGEAVAIGLAAALGVSIARTGLAPDAANDVTRLLARLGLPLQAPPELDPARVLELLASDKKREGTSLNFVALRAPGRPELLPVRPDAGFAALLLGRDHG